MRLKTFLVIAAFIYLGFGIGLLSIPGPLMALYGLILDSWGQVIARILGTSLIAFALVFWLIRGSPISDASLAVIRASFLYNILDVPIIGFATVTGVMSPMGWQAAGLHLFLAAGFGYFSRADVAPPAQTRRVVEAADHST
jgi:hypothetical protein